MLEELHLRRYTTTFKAKDKVVLPRYKGSTFRGALGYAFKKVACALPRKQCESCLLRYRCAYSVCFETPVPEDAAIMRKYPFAPHPFVLEPPLDDRTTYEPGEEFSVVLCLIGRGNDSLGQFIYAFEELGNNGLGGERGKAELISLTAEEEGRPRAVYDHTEERLVGEAPCIGADDVARRADELKGRILKLIFDTPTRIKFDGKLCRDPKLRKLFPSLLRRLNSLCYFHCGGEEGGDVRPLLDAAAQVETVRSDVHWVDWGRYSGRQQIRMKLGGFVGTLEHRSVAPELLPYLVWGELLHIGKASAFGLGQYRIQAM